MKSLLVILFQICLIKSAFSRCPVEDDPTNLARCIQVDVSAIVAVAKGSDDVSSFCALANRYMECIKTYTRGCLGFYVFFFKFKFFIFIKNLVWRGYLDRITKYSPLLLQWSYYFKRMSFQS